MKLNFVADAFEADTDDGEGMASVYLGSDTTALSLSRYVDADTDDKAIEVQLGHQDFILCTEDVRCTADVDHILVIAGHEAEAVAHYAFTKEDKQRLVAALKAVFHSEVGHLNITRQLLDHIGTNT